MNKHVFSTNRARARARRHDEEGRRTSRDAVGLERVGGADAADRGEGGAGESGHLRRVRGARSSPGNGSVGGDLASWRPHSLPRVDHHRARARRVHQEPPIRSIKIYFGSGPRPPLVSRFLPSPL